MEFANTVGQALWMHLAREGHEQLGALSDMDRFSSLLTAALIPLGEVLREPVENSKNPAAMADRLVELAGRQLRSLLQGAVEPG
jgi:hypothetical protein